MSRNREAVVIIIDCGKTMSRKRRGEECSGLESAIKAVNLLIQQKLIHSKQDYVGIVLMGTEETKNRLSESGYSHISVLSPLQIPSLSLLHSLLSISPSSFQADCLSLLLSFLFQIFFLTAKIYFKIKTQTNKQPKNKQTNK